MTVLNSSFKPGDDVEVREGCLARMEGYRYGTVERLGEYLIHVRLVYGTDTPMRGPFMGRDTVRAFTPDQLQWDRR